MSARINRLFSFADAVRADWPDEVARTRWPCPYEAYDDLRESFTRVLAEMPAAYAGEAHGPDVFGDASDRAAAMWLAIGLGVLTLTQATRYAIEAAHAADAGQRWLGDPAQMPMLAWLLSDGDRAPSGLAARWQKLGGAGGLGLAARRGLALMQLELPSRRRAPRVATAAPLFDELRRADGLDAPVYIGREILGMDDLPPAALVRADTRGVAERWGEVAIGAIDVLDARLRRRLVLLAGLVFAATVSTAWRDMAFVRRRMPRRRLGAMLCSGTPKHPGRVLGWWYRRHGLPVLRFAHGGDRGTHYDPGWDLIEMPFCSRYFGHGATERDALAARAAGGLICEAFPETPAFETRGSLRHQALFEQGRARAPRPAGSKCLLYVPGKYGSEAATLSPVFKTPDHLYAEWQLWLVRALQDRGYDVTIKVHPRERAGETAVMRRTGCRLIGGHLDAVAADTDCMVFDFPGSAWFQALGSQAAVVLTDIGPRRLDPASADALRARCPHVPTFQDESNRPRMDMDAFDSAVAAAEARPGCDGALAHGLFWQ